MKVLGFETGGSAPLVRVELPEWVVRGTGRLVPGSTYRRWWLFLLTSSLVKPCQQCRDIFAHRAVPVRRAFLDLGV